MNKNKHHLTGRSLFSGGEGVGLGMKAAGIRILPGIEYDKEIAEVAKNNGFETIVEDILDINPWTLEFSDILHASPPCPNFSIANSQGGETKLDIDMAKKIASFIKIQLPKYFTLENVYAYRKSQSWKLIAQMLNKSGYWYDLTHVNAADFSVPQTRKRMIVRAIKGGFLPPLPSAEEWIGWYKAIEDLIPDLPKSQFAQWQLKHLPEEVESEFLASGGNSSGKVTFREKDDPAFTVIDSSNKAPIKAFLIGAQSGFRPEQRMFRYAEKPTFSVTSGHNQLTMRAFVTDSRNNRENIDGKMIIRRDDEPIFTVSATSAAERYKTWLPQGKVVSLSTRCLARFQTFPDSYLLPDKKTLACKVIGNAVPPLLYQKIIEGLVT